jgi:hypothetical protein
MASGRLARLARRLGGTIAVTIVLAVAIAAHFGRFAALALALLIGRVASLLRLLMLLLMLIELQPSLRLLLLRLSRPLLSLAAASSRAPLPPRPLVSSLLLPLTVSMLLGLPASSKLA